MMSASAFRRWLGRLLVGLMLAHSLGVALALEVTDDRGQVVRFDQPPKRVVSLLPSLTETVCALGQCARLVGVDRYSNFPASVRRLPQVGGGLDPSIEAIVALRPDVVLLALSTRAHQRLEALGLKVVVLEPKTHADVQRVLLTVGQLLGLRDAQRVWRGIEADVLAAAQSLPAAVASTRVYFEASGGGYGASEASFIGETLTRLGVKNIVPGRLGVFPKLNPEFVVRADPDLIMVGARNAPDLLQRPGWQQLRAVREHRVCVFDNEQADALVRAGPRMAEGAWLMARCAAGQLKSANAPSARP